MTIRRATPNLFSHNLEGAREFYEGFLGFELAMDEPDFMMFRSPSNPTAQVLVGSQRKTFAEKDLASITFAIAATSNPLAAEDAALARLIDEFPQLPAGPSAGERNANSVLIPKLAAAGPRIIRPLLAAFQKHDGDYQAVGEVLKQIGPDAFSLLIECVRDDSGRSARFPVWWAIRESGTRHAPFVQGLLKDKDPRIRLLGMDILYSWSITSGVALPKTLDLSLIQILDDPEDDVGLQPAAAPPHEEARQHTPESSNEHPRREHDECHDDFPFPRLRALGFGALRAAGTAAADSTRPLRDRRGLGPAAGAE